ncbi:branched-chain amino acid ABC transporter permease [Polaromonas sp. C04]|uniref:branched-chain amino acid ABC transporter permease n=1 Tax=Polaromonas sp. C04 TaxID=1945857 RepID=UPI000987C969|nr:branched-chain amino acid ABC transporter permease [Polaromonas sp. C04]OOG51194.1 branched-chain amino acid ABC transporter permease [Polaromonas sp. C04]
MLLLSVLLNGLVFGSVLMLFSLGLTLIYGVGRVVNFAHGAFFSVGAFVGMAMSTAGQPFWVCLIATPLLVAVGGALLDWAVLARLRDRPMLDGLLLTFGIALALTGVLYAAGGRSVQLFPVPPALAGSTSIGGVGLPTYRLFLAGFAAALMLALMVCLGKTTWGLRVRAANDQPEMAACLGINRETLMHSVVGVGAALAAVAGVAAAPIVTVQATVGDKLLILGFLTVIIGGLGSFRGAIVAAYVVGLTLIAGEVYLGGQLAMILLLVVVMVMLVKWPRGFFNEGRVE